MVDTVAPRLTFELTETDHQTIVGKISADGRESASCKFAILGLERIGRRNPNQLPAQRSAYYARHGQADGEHHLVSQKARPFRGVCNDFRQSATSNAANQRDGGKRAGFRAAFDSRNPFRTAAASPGNGRASSRGPNTFCVGEGIRRRNSCQSSPMRTNTDPSATTSPSAPDVTEELPPPLQDFDPPKDAAHDQPQRRAANLVGSGIASISCFARPATPLRCTIFLKRCRDSRNCSSLHRKTIRLVPNTWACSYKPSDIRRCASNWNFWSPNRGRRPTIG